MLRLGMAFELELKINSEIFTAKRKELLRKFKNAYANRLLWCYEKRLQRKLPDGEGMELVPFVVNE